MITRCLAFLLFMLAISGVLRAAEPMVRVDIMTPGPIVPGQQVEVQVDVLVPNFFLSPPRFPIFDLPNTIVTLPDIRAQNLVETIDGQSYSGIRRTYIVTPQVAGDFVLPQAQITFTYAAVPGQSADGSVTLPAKKFTVAGAPAGGAATAAAVTIVQSLDRDPKDMKAGDTLVRTVEVTAQGMQAMMIPVPVFDAPEGVRIYPHDPVLSDEAGEGQSLIGGKRVDRVTYAFEKPGNYLLPAIEIGWYDPAAQQREVARAPEITISVSANAAFKPAIAPPAASGDTAPKPRNTWWKVLPWAAAGLAVLAALLWLVPPAWSHLRAWLKARRMTREHSEAAYFQRFADACQRGECSTAYSALDSWSRRANIAPVTAWLSASGDKAALSEFERLEGALFAAKPEAGFCDTKILLTAISQARKNWLAREGKTISAPALVPALNP